MVYMAALRRPFFVYEQSECVWCFLSFDEPWQASPSINAKQRE
jgi:hypothetical protein